MRVMLVPQLVMMGTMLSLSHRQKEDITFPDTPMERSHVNEKLRGLYLPAFLGGSRDLVVQFCRSRFMIFYLMVLASSV